MIHIDHSLLPNAANPSPAPPPEPAIPTLASNLFDLEEKQRKRFARNVAAERLNTGCREVDEVLGGGLERGIVLGVSSGAEGSEGRLVSFFLWVLDEEGNSNLLSEGECWRRGLVVLDKKVVKREVTCDSLSLHLLASSLLPHPTSPSSTPKTKATIIDATGSFPLPLLFSVLKSRILWARSVSAQNEVKTGNYPVQKPGFTIGEGDVDREVESCLEMVAISRVFDVEGLWEVLGEIDQDTSSSGNKDPESWNGPKTGETEKDISPEVLDSQEELSPEEVFPDSAPNPRSGKSERDRDEGTEVIIVDNMTHLINELFARKEKSDAHNLLTILSSTLHTITKTQNILTILHNSTTPTNTKASYLPNPQSRQQQQTQTQKSIFTSTTTKPALGQIFSQFPDLHVFLHEMPRRREDAEMLYRGDEEALRDDEEEGTVGYCTAVEVLKDECPILGSDRGIEGRKFGWREQRWTAVVMDESGTGLVGAFQEKGGMRGLGLERDINRGLSGGVGNVAKIYGFGGRRV